MSLPSLRLLEGGKFHPEQFSPVLVREYNQIRLKFFKWGLVPGWAKDTLASKQRAYLPAGHALSSDAYRLPIRRNRCLIPADGYYVEKKGGNNNQTYKLSHPEQFTFCFAGIFDTWKNPSGGILQTFSILTTESSSSVRKFGLQMPLILPKSQENTWLNPNTSEKVIHQLLSGQSSQSLRVHPVQELKDLGIQEFLEQVAA